MELICSISGEESTIYIYSKLSPLNSIHIFCCSHLDRILVDIVLRRYPLKDNDITFVYIWKVYVLGLLISYGLSYLVRVYFEDSVRTILMRGVSTENRKLKNF